MLKKTITYDDFDGNSFTEEFYFNLSKPEIIEFNASFKDGLEKELERITKANDAAGLLAIMKRLITESYGVRSEDGKRFIKEPELTKEFTQTNAYSALYMQLVQDDKMADAFIKGIIPADMIVEIENDESKKKTAEALGISPPKDENNA